MPCELAYSKEGGRSVGERKPKVPLLQAYTHPLKFAPGSFCFGRFGFRKECITSLGNYI